MTTRKSIYLDYAAATPVDIRVLEKMRIYYDGRFYNPSATYLAAKQVNDDLNCARAEVAQILGARQSEIIFTAGGTEANNLSIKGILHRYPKANVVVSSIEHESVLKPAEAYQHQLIPVQSNGIIEPNAVIRCIDDDTVLVSVMYVNNEVGTIQPLREIALAINKIRESRKQHGNSLPIYLHTDAAQAANYLDIHVARLGVDLMTLNGGKIYGPKASGALFIKSSVMIDPLIEGGGQERNLRSGTENVPASIGFAEALKITQEMHHQERERLQKLQELFFSLLEQQLPQVVVNGSRSNRIPNNVHITIPGTDNERILFALDEASVLAAAGSACSASNEEPSHVLQAMGVTASDAQASLRFTMGRQTTEAHVRQAVDHLSRLVS